MHATSRTLSTLVLTSPSDGDSGPRTSNYRGALDGFSNENWGVIVMGAFALFLLVMIRRAFKR